MSKVGMIGIGSWGRTDSNREPSDYEPPALTVELHPRWLATWNYASRPRCSKGKGNRPGNEAQEHCEQRLVDRGPPHGPPEQGMPAHQ